MLHGLIFESKYDYIGDLVSIPTFVQFSLESLHITGPIARLHIPKIFPCVYVLSEI